VGHPELDLHQLVEAMSSAVSTEEGKRREPHANDGSDIPAGD